VSSTVQIEESVLLRPVLGVMARSGLNPAVSVATAVVLYLAAHGGRRDYDRDPGELVRLAVKAQWHRDPPHQVIDWLAERETGD
jgi:hypothetical protein